MPESMAMLKLKGFIHDLGGEVVESVPGMIRVRLPEPAGEAKGAGLFGAFGRRPAAVASFTEIELHMQRPDPSQPGRLVITLVLHPPARRRRRRGGRGATTSAATCRRISS